MTHEELEQRYGPYLAELVSQAVTLDVFRRLDEDELSSYFSLRAARAYQEYIGHQEAPAVDDGRDLTLEAYRNILRRRWQDAEFLAQMIVRVDRDLSSFSLIQPKQSA